MKQDNTTWRSLRSLQDWNLKLAIESVPGVSQVASIGGFVKQYQITIDPNRLLAYNIPITKVMEAVRRSNLDVEGRVIEFSGIEYMVRGRGYIKTIADLEDIAVATNGAGTPIYLKDIARIQLGPEIRRGVAELNGKGESSRRHCYHVDSEKMSSMLLNGSRQRSPRILRLRCRRA